MTKRAIAQTFFDLTSSRVIEPSSDNRLFICLLSDEETRMKCKNE